MKNTLKLLALSLIAASILSLIKAQSASAASMTVNTDTNPSTCTLDEAIENINDQAQTNADCVETGSYGVNDSITIPEGTVLLTADLPNITRSVAIEGAGMGQTIINGANGQYFPLGFLGTNGDEQFSASGFTVKAFRGGGIGSFSGNTIISRVEVDGTDALVEPSFGFFSGIVFQNSGSSPNSIDISDVYIHNLNSVGQNTNVNAGIIISAKSSANNIANMHNVTISDSAAGTQAVVGIFIANGVFGNSTDSTGKVTASVSNTTVTNLESTAQPGQGIATQVNGSVNEVDLRIENSTITSIRGVDPGFGFSSMGISSIVMAPQTGDSPVSNIVANNVINESTCLALDASYLFVGPGASSESAPTLTSVGGNLSSDTTCTPYFTQPTDQNNLTNIVSTLSPLADNGGYIPTMALKQGSPAIDSGVTIAGLTQDARLAARPQGTAFDSGAYESPFTKPVASLADTGENITIVVLLALTTLLISVGLVSLTRRQQC